MTAPSHRTVPPLYVGSMPELAPTRPGRDDRVRKAVIAPLIHAHRVGAAQPEQVRDLGGIKKIVDVDEPAHSAIVVVLTQRV